MVIGKEACRRIADKVRSHSGWLLLAVALAGPAQARLIQVGPEREFRAPSQAALLARDGDTVEIDAGVYPGDATVWRANRLTLRGVGGRARLESRGVAAEGKGIWVIKGRDTTVEHIEFLDARVPDRNGAGIRLEGANLTVRHCLFRDNQNGILTGANPDSELLVEHAEFDHNGHGDGRSHNIYVGAIRKFTLRYSFSHLARVGHQVKSRAAHNHIYYNRISDDGSGHSSYLLDLPAGGVAYVVGNVFQQGAFTENYTMVSYGAEQILHPENRLFLIHNTLVNLRPGGCRLLAVNGASQPALAVNNLVTDCAGLAGPVSEQGNVRMPLTGYADPANFDFHLRGGAAAIDRGVPLVRKVAPALAPARQYLHPLKDEARPMRGLPDAGAYEYRGGR